MDTQAYLLKHGWRGTGHSLDTSNKGLRKPLLISKKVDVLGIGINKHDVIADQWWMKAFDSSLKDFGTGKKSLLGQVREHGVKRGGLYARFVQGESEGGTIGTKRKAEDEVEVFGAKKVKTGKRNKSKTSSTETSDTETRKRKAKKSKTLDTLPADKRAQYASRAAAKNLSLEEYFSLRTAKNLEAKSSRRQTPVSEPVSDAPATTVTTKDPKRQRKTGKKEKKDTSDEGTSGKKEQKVLAEKMLQAARRKLNGEVLDAEAKDLPDILVTSKEGDFTTEEQELATKAAKRALKSKKGKKA